MSENIDKILDPKNERFTLFPISNIGKKYYDAYKTAQSLYWTVEEMDLARDLEDWDKLNNDEKHFIKMVLAFFSSSDGIVNENISTNFVDEVKILEAKMFYHFQETIEDVHNEAYSLLIDTYIKDENEKKKLFNAMNEIECIKLKANWALKYLNKDCSFAERILAFAAVEGIFFSGSFCAIYWLKFRGLMPGLSFSNELISRDEGLHTDFACLVYKDLTNKLDEEKVHSIFKHAVDIEINFITDALPCSLVGMNNNLMNQYIKYCCDRILQQLGYNKLYDVEQPFDFMELISMRNKVNFFEKRVQDYKKATTKKIFNLNAKF
tara:strand:+ start:1566 stop:2531 length:966 start_codon:yes stop_codon:yes gene_type:complete